MTWIENYMENFISKSFVVVLVVWGAILLLMLTFAIITAVVASRKGRNGFGWFFYRTVYRFSRTCYSPCNATKEILHWRR